MSPLLRQALEQFTGAHTLGTPQRLHPAFRDGADDAAEVVTALNPSRGVLHELSAQGYTRVHRLVILPSTRNPRWLVPQQATRSARQLDLYAPYAPVAKAAKALLAAAAKSGWQGWARDKVLVASRTPLRLERLVSEVSGEREPVFALSLGTPGKFRKLTVQVMRRSGEVIGYLKLPLTQPAVGRIRHEAEVLRYLAGFPGLHECIPAVLYANEWCDGYLLFESGGPAASGPAELTEAHRKFLRTLRGVRRSEQPVHLLADQVTGLWLATEPLMNPQARLLCERALAAASRDLEGALAVYGLAHGDFAPWNTRMGRGQLYVFDWESARWDAPQEWDVFHFKAQVASLLRKPRASGLGPHSTRQDRASYLLYLVNSLCLLVEETGSCSHAGARYRVRALEATLN